MSSGMQFILVMMGALAFAQAGHVWEDHEGIRNNWGAFAIAGIGLLLVIIALFYDPTTSY